MIREVEKYGTMTLKTVRKQKRSENYKDNLVDTQYMY